MPVSINDQIVDNAIKSKVDLLRFTESVREDILVILENLQKELRTKILDADLAGIARTREQVKATEELIDQTNETIATAFADSTKTLDAQIVGLSSLEQKAALLLINKPLQAILAKPVFVAEELRALTKLPIVLGAPARDWWAQQSADLQFRFAAQIQMGILQGERNDAIVQRIIGRTTGKRSVLVIDGESRVIAERSGGIMAVSRRSAMALVRTSVMSVSNYIHNEVYDANSDILQGKQLLVTLDSKTSYICMARAGAAWDFNGNPLPSSPVKIKYPGPPPYHFHCRSVLIPLLKSWEEISGIRGAKAIPAGTRASMDGQVPAGDLTYESWLKTKSDAFQQEVLGAGRYNLWKSGSLTLPQLIDQSGNSLTLDELRKLVI